MAALRQTVREGRLSAAGPYHCALDGDFSNISDGCTGAQLRMALLRTCGVCWGKITRQKFIELFATNPAKVAGLSKKCQLRVGTAADAVIFDPRWKGAIANADSLNEIDYEPFGGFAVQDGPERVCLRGRLVAKDGKSIGNKGGGTVA